MPKITAPGGPFHDSVPDVAAVKDEEFVRFFESEKEEHMKITRKDFIALATGCIDQMRFRRY